MTAVARVAELAEQIRGVTYSKQDASSTPRPGYLPVLRAGNISEHGLVFDDLVFVPAERISERQKIRKNDVVIAASSGSIDIVGKAARALADYEGGFGAFCKVLRPGPDVDPAYFAHYFRTPAYRRRISALAAGVNINNLRNEHLDEIQIRLPPLSEQRRIAEILDKADALRAKRRAALVQLDALTQSIFLDMFGDPATNPKGMRKEPLGDLIKLKSGDFLPGAEMAASGEYPVMGGNGVSGFHDQYMFEERQIVIGRVGVYCGCVHVSPPKSWVTDNAMYVSERSSELLFDYLVHALTHARLNRYASQFGQPLVSGSRIYPIEVLVPPNDLQKAFADRIGRTEELASAHRSSVSELDALFASLQQRAFRGEL
jgi:type I restriction enzyme S subunit